MSMILEDKTYLIVTNLYDGLFAGGLIMVLSEVSAEVAYPVGESISLGFINALQYLIRFLIRFIVDIMTFNENDPQRDLKPDISLSVYFILMVIFLLLTICAYVLLMKAPFHLRRSLADACMAQGEDANESSS